MVNHADHLEFFEWGGSFREVSKAADAMSMDRPPRCRFHVHDRHLREAIRSGEESALPETRLSRPESGWAESDDWQVK